MKKKLLDWSINATRNAHLYTQRSYIYKNLFGFFVVIILLLTLVIGPK